MFAAAFSLEIVAILLGAWVAIEVIFWIFLHFVIVARLQQINKPQKYAIPPLHLIKKILDSMDKLKTYTFDRFLHGFFRGAQRSHIKKENMYSFLAWAMFASHLRDLTPEQVANIDVIYADTCSRYGPLEEGHNPSVSHIAMTLEPVPYIHRPLLFYVAVGVAELFSNVVFFKLKGFQRLELLVPGGNGEVVTYWHRPARIRRGNNSSGQRGTAPAPMVFYHGISPGWLAYAAFVETLSASSLHRDVFLIDLDCIKIKSMNFVMPSNETHADGVAAVLRRHGVRQASIVGHSFGTIAAAWFVKRHPDMVSHLSLVDPVSLLLFFPDVAYAFLYRFPSTVVEWVIYLAAAREITISNTLYRNFWWYNNLLWLEDLPAHVGVVVGISGSDQVANPASLMEYVQQCRGERQQLRDQQVQEEQCEGQSEECREDGGSCGGSGSGTVAPIEAVYWPGYSHGQVLVSLDAQKALHKCMEANEGHAL